MSDLLFIPATLIVLFLPGAVWQIFTRPGRLDALEKIAETAGASLALTGLAALYLFLAGIQLSAAGVIGLYLAVLEVGLVGFARRGFSFKISAKMLLGVGAALALFAWRLYQARELALPVWVDPVHHVLLVRKIVEYGGLPPDWQPYLAVPMYYHYGFHVLAAVFTFWSRQSPAQAVLIFGQVINAMVAFSVYRLAKAAWGSALRAGLAGLFTAFAFHMPAYYLTWGRYPLLAGLVVLPLAMAAALEVRRSSADRAAWIRLALYSAAVCYCHFLAVGLLGLFFLVLLGAEVVHGLKARSWRAAAWQPFAAAALGALVAAPWLWRVWSYTHQMFAIEIPNSLSSGSDAAGLWEYLLYLTGPQRSHILLILAGVGLLFGLVQGRARLLAVWGLLVAFLATPYGPRFDPFRPDHLAIVLFLPGSLLLSELLVAVGEWLGGIEWPNLLRFLSARRTRVAVGAGQNSLLAVQTSAEGSSPGVVFTPEAAADGQASTHVRPPDRWKLGLAIGLPLLIGLGLSLWGFWETRTIVNPVTVLANSSDLAANDWVEQNTPSSARFFINSTQWMSGIYRGTDGGFWLLTLTGRFALVPPLVAGWGDLQDTLRLTDWARRASQVTACDESFWSLVREARLDYAYLRQGSGSLQPEALDNCPGAEKVFSQGGVNIYFLTPP